MRHPITPSSTFLLTNLSLLVYLTTCVPIWELVSVDAIDWDQSPASPLQKRQVVCTGERCELDPDRCLTIQCGECGPATTTIDPRTREEVIHPERFCLDPPTPDVHTNGGAGTGIGSETSEGGSNQASQGSGSSQNLDGFDPEGSGGSTGSASPADVVEMNRKKQPTCRKFPTLLSSKPILLKR